MKLKKKDLLERIIRLEQTVKHLKDQLKQHVDPVSWEVEQNMRRIGRNMAQEFWNAGQDALKPPFIVTSGTTTGLCAPAVTMEPLTFDGLESICGQYVATHVEEEEVEEAYEYEDYEYPDLSESEASPNSYAGFRNKPPYKRIYD